MTRMRNSHHVVALPPSHCKRYRHIFVVQTHHHRWTSHRDEVPTLPNVHTAESTHLDIFFVLQRPFLNQSRQRIGAFLAGGDVCAGFVALTWLHWGAIGRENGLLVCNSAGLPYARSCRHPARPTLSPWLSLPLSDFQSPPASSSVHTQAPQPPEHNGRRVSPTDHVGSLHSLCLMGHTGTE